MSALAGQVALVTGASRGIGAAVAVELARLGAHVVIVARTQGGLEETDDAIRALNGSATGALCGSATGALCGSATLLPLDLKDGDELDRVGPSLVERFGRLDILVHNAGALGTLTPVAHIQPRDWAEVVGVNLTSAWHLIRSCGPVLLGAPAGRAVFVTSGIVAQPRAYWGAYGATKAGMEHLVLTWADETEQTRLRINLFSPGVVATRMRARAMPAEDATPLAKPADVAPVLVALCLPEETRHGEVVRFDGVQRRP